MGVVKTLIGLGIGVLGFGFYWMLQDNIIDTYLSKYVISHAYNDLSFLMWDGMPVIVILVGVFCLVLAGIKVVRN